MSNGFVDCFVSIRLPFDVSKERCSDTFKGLSKWFPY